MTDIQTVFIYCRTCCRFPDKGFVNGLCTKCGSPSRILPKSPKSLPDDWFVGLKWGSDLAGRELLPSCHFTNSTNDKAGSLETTPVGIQFADFVIPWDEVSSMRVATSETSRVTVARVLAIGIFALAAKKKEQFSVLEIEANNTIFGFVTTESQTSVFSRVRPFVIALKEFMELNLERSNVVQTEVLDSLPSNAIKSDTQGLSLAEEIRELGALLNDGLLTSEEFSAAKRKLLER
jgi:hypothetical protein